jgi:hypothetical protein
MLVFPSPSYIFLLTYVVEQAYTQFHYEQAFNSQARTGLSRL